MKKFIFLILGYIVAFPVQAALTLAPVVPGYDGVRGSYRALAPDFSYPSNSSSYGTTARLTVSGKTITIPAKLRLSVNDGNYLKKAIRLNPLLLAGTLAAGWLIDQGLEWSEAQKQWLRNGTSGLLSYPFRNPCSAGPHFVTSYQGCYDMGLTGTAANRSNQNSQCLTLGSGFVFGDTTGTNVNNARYSYCMAPLGYIQPKTKEPMPEADWAALPNPSPVLAPELPFAPYLPDGVPVENPTYDFVPYTTPIGNPYTRPDGSTVQPSAKISPNVESVTIDTFDQPLTEPNGQPVVDPKPQDTPEPTRDPCLDNPGRLGCMNSGTDDFAMPKSTINFTFTPEANPFTGGCPAPISVGAHSISFQPVCNAMSMIRPVVIGMAGVLAAFILIGAFRGDD